MPGEVIRATYTIETSANLEAAAETLAGEQSTGTFVRVPGETDDLRARHAAQVESIEPLGESDSPGLPYSRTPRDGARCYQRGRVVVAFPLENVGPSLPNLLATVAGNLFELREFSGLRLEDIELPPAFAARYPGPRFGIDGTRRLAGVSGRPIIGTIVKPSVGLSPDQTATLVESLVTAGLDFIKDDELMADPPHSPFQVRVAAVMRVIHERANATGRKAMYAFNVTGDLDLMLRHAETVREAGGTCVMVSVNSAGLPAVTELSRRCGLPIHGHRNGWGALTRCPHLGFGFKAYQKLWRLAGVDHLHTNGLRNKFWEPDESVIDSARACLAPMFGGYRIMPVLSSAQWAGQAPDTYRALGTTDLMYLCGGGILAHPAGPAAGVLSVRQGWEAALRGASLEEYAQTHPELRQAIEKFGG